MTKEHNCITRDEVVANLLRLREEYVRDDDRTPYDTLTVIIQDVKDGKYDNNLEEFYENVVGTITGYCGVPDEA